jgi:hypothetical protein
MPTMNNQIPPMTVNWPTVNFPGLSPTYQDVVSGLQTPVNLPDIEKPITAGIRPEIQSMLDQITRTAESKARATVLRRGMEGSTTEALNVGKAIASEQAPLLAESARQNSALEMAYLEHAAQRGNVRAQLELQRQQAISQLGSDERVSQQNLGATAKELQLQERLAERTAQIMEQNIGVSKEIAEQQAQNEMHGALISSFGPVIAMKMLGVGGGGGSSGFLGMGGGGGAAGVGGLSGMLGGSSTILGQATGAPMVGATMPAGGTASVAGLGTVPVAGSTTNALGGFAANPVLTPLAGLGGWQLGMNTIGATPNTGERGAMNVGAGIGGVAGGLIGGPLGAGVGAFLGTAFGKASVRFNKGVEKKLGGTAGSVAKYANPVTAISSISKKISRAFPF